jgi:hypothetical protein
MLGMVFTDAFFYKNFFVTDPELKYVGGEVRQYKTDSDKWSFFEIDGICSCMERRGAFPVG